MKVRQYPYLSPGAKRLREVDDTPPWGVHVCEVDDFSQIKGPDGFCGVAHWLALEEARELRRELEQDDD